MKVTFHQPTHTYTDEQGQRYTSVTTLVGQFKPAFDPDGQIAARCAAKAGITPAQMVARWEKVKTDAGEFGTRLHKSVEMWLKPDYEPELGDEEDKFARAGIQVCGMVGRGTAHSEVLLSSRQDRLAGTADLLVDLTGDKRTVKLYDFKTPAKGIQKANQYGGQMLAPVSHLDDCNFTHYELQLNLYARMLKQKGVTVLSMTVLWFNRATGLFEPHECQDRQAECEAMVRQHKKGMK